LPRPVYTTAPDDSRGFDAGDDLDAAAASLAGFDVDVEYTFQAACPFHGSTLSG
jgi:hypothetical protein